MKKSQKNFFRKLYFHRRLFYLIAAVILFFILSVCLLNHFINRTAEEGSPITAPVFKVIGNIPCIDQREDYPAGCESVSAVMALNAAGIQIDADTFIDDFLPRAALPTKGEAGASPWDYFLGDPRSESGWGCYSSCLCDSINRAIGDNKPYRAYALRNLPLQELCREYIDRDIPVILWATRGMRSAKKGMTWQTGRGAFTWISPMHCLLLIGYGENTYIFNDPLTGTQTTYPAELVQAAYEALYQQAVAICPLPTSQAA